MSNDVNQRFSVIVSDRISYTGREDKLGQLAILGYGKELTTAMLEGKANWEKMEGVFEKLDNLFYCTPGYFSAVYDNVRARAATGWLDSEIIKLREEVLNRLVIPNGGRAEISIVLSTLYGKEHPHIGDISITDKDGKPVPTVFKEFLPSYIKEFHAMSHNKIYQDFSAGNVVEYFIKKTRIGRGIIGILLPEMGTVEHYEFLDDLFNLNNPYPEHNFVFVPCPKYVLGHSADPQHIKDQVGRVERDSVDGLRYNRTTIALYEKDPGSAVVQAHDVFISMIHKGGVIEGTNWVIDELGEGYLLQETIDNGSHN